MNNLQKLTAVLFTILAVVLVTNQIINNFTFTL